MEGGDGIVREGASDPGNETLPVTLDAHLAQLADLGAGWTVDPRAYQYNMTLTARLVTPDGGDPTADDVVAAMVDGEVRGIGRPQYMPHLGAWVVFLMVYSNETEGETVTFQVFDNGRGEAFLVDEPLGFEADGVAGDIAHPMPLTVTGHPGDPGNRPTALLLTQNFPNPPQQGFTTIRFETPQAGLVRMNLYDVAGRLVRTLVNEVQPAGLHLVVADVQDLSNGIYFYRLETGGQSLVRKMILAR